jgi:hypothetical protein
MSAIGAAGSGSSSFGSQAVAHAQARLAADQASKCAPCTLKEDQKAVESAQGLAAAETSASAQTGRLLDIKV